MSKGKTIKKNIFLTSFIFFFNLLTPLPHFCIRNECNMISAWGRVRWMIYSVIDLEVIQVAVKPPYHAFSFQHSHSRSLDLSGPSVSLGLLDGRIQEGVQWTFIHWAQYSRIEIGRGNGRFVLYCIVEGCPFKGNLSWEKHGGYHYWLFILHMPVVW